MTALEVYQNAVRQLPPDEKLEVLRLIIMDIAPNLAIPPDAEFEYLRSILPEIERIVVTDEDLANIDRKYPLPI